MADTQKLDGVLEAAAAAGFERRWSRFARIVYAVETLVLVAAAAGLFGRGPLSRATAGTRGGPFWVEYERRARFRTPTMLTIHLGATAAQGAEASVRLTDPIRGRLPVSRVMPQPAVEALVPNGRLYTFRIASPGDSASIEFELQPDRVGRSRITAGVDGVAPVSVTQFVYP